jgi:hypothetical protein
LRPPLIEATAAEVEGLRSALGAAGLPTGEAVSG